MITPLVALMFAIAARSPLVIIYPPLFKSLPLDYFCSFFFGHFGDFCRPVSFSSI